MARVLVTNFHQRGGGGHVPYIQALTQIPEFEQHHTIGVAVPASSRLYEYLKGDSYPFVWPCDFPAKIQRELPSILKSIRAFRKVASEFQPDIVHTNGPPDLFIAAWSHPLHTPYAIVRTHHRTKGIPTDPYHRWLYRKVKANVYVAQAAFDLCTIRGLVPTDPCVIENGVDLERFRPIPRNAALAAKYGIENGRFCFGSCAGTGPYKRIDTIIDAGVQLKREGLGNFTILVLGDESTGVALQNMAREKGLDEFIYCGFHKDVSSHVSLFDAGFILSDRIETISFAAREMMAMGKPLISSSFSGLKQNVQHGVNGFVVEPGNVGDIASAMKRFLKMDREALRGFSLKARERAVSNFDIVQQKKAHAMLYERVAKSAGRM